MFYDILEQENAFLGYKKQKFDKSKNCHFFDFFFLGNIGQENVFYDVLEQKDAFLGFKTRSSKGRKIAIFLKGLTHGFGPKIAIFPTSFFLGKIGQENVFYDILERKKAFLGYKNKTCKKSKNCYFSKGVNPSFLDKNVLFCDFFLLGEIAQENVFYYILERKNAFLGSKKRSLKSQKISIFLKGLIHGFCTKMSFFGISFFYGKIGQENVFDHIVERKNAFLGSKNQKIRKSKNCHFSKGVNPCFWFKNDRFSTFFF